MTRTTTLILAAMAMLSMPTASYAAGKRLPGERAGVTQHRMQCDPRQVKAGDTLHIRLPSHHGGDFAVKSPKGELYFIAFSELDPAAPLQPLIAVDAFKTMTEFSVKAAELEGIPSWTPGPKRGIFKESGIYTVLVSPALETEDPDIQGWCKIRFKR